MKIKDESVKPGYKMTPLGEIPEDWEVKKLSTITRIQAGGTPSTGREEYWGGEIKWMASGELNQKKVYEVENRITEAGLKNSNTKILPINCVLVGLAGQGKTRGTVAINKVELCTNQSIAAILPNEKFEPDFIYYNLDSRYSELRQLSTGDGGRGGLNLKLLGALYIPLPSRQEQLTIMKVLSTWDESIEKTRQLIEQKELRKKALMQQLLTGKKRLRGFSGEWKEMRLGEVFSERNETKTQGLSLLTIGRDGIYLQSESSKRDVSSDDKSKYKRICPGDIGYNTMRMWQGRSVLSHLEGIVSPAYTVVTASEGHSSEFYALLFTLPEVVYKFYRHSQGLVSDTLNCKFPDFAQIKVHTPCVQEQIAIAKSFRIADTEIKIEKQKLEQLKLQKKALMQVLLTGKKRLV